MQQTVEAAKFRPTNVSVGPPAVGQSAVPSTVVWLFQMSEVVAAQPRTASSWGVLGSTTQPRSSIKRGGFSPSSLPKLVQLTTLATSHEVRSCCIGDERKVDCMFVTRETSQWFTSEAKLAAEEKVDCKVVTRETSQWLTSEAKLAAEEKVRNKVVTCETSQWFTAEAKLAA